MKIKMFLSLGSSELLPHNKTLKVAPVITTLSIIANMTHSNDRDIYFIQSSDNNFPLDEGRLQPAIHPIYLKNTSTSQWQKI